MNQHANSDDRAQQIPIIVIGAGIVGVSTAIWLQRAGYKVTILDREGPAAGTSYGNAGLLASCAVVPVNAPGLIKTAPAMILNPDSPLFLKWSYLPKLLPWLARYLSRANTKDATAAAKALTQIMFDSVEQHQALAEGTGAEKWLIPSDYVFVYNDRKAFEKEAFSWNLRKQMGFTWDEMTPAEFEEYDPLFKGSNKFAVRLKNHGHLTDPGKYVTDLTDHFINKGGRLIIAEAQDIIQSNGGVTGVKTNIGTIDCQQVVLASGIWSSPLAKKLGFNPALETERGYHIELINPSHMPRAPVMLSSGKFVITPMEGRLRCAGIVEFGGLDIPPSKAPIDLLKKQITQALPNLKYDRIEEWMGHRPATADSVPTIGKVKNVKGAYAAFGHQHIGLTAGPKTGRMIADMISGKSSNIDLTPYSVSRFG